MSIRKLTTTTAIICALTAGGVAGPSHAQTMLQPPLCENKRGKVWNKILPRGYDKLAGYTEQTAEAARSLAALAAVDAAGQGKAICLVELGDLTLYPYGKQTADGRVIARRDDVLEAAQRANVRLYLDGGPEQTEAERKAQEKALKKAEKKARKNDQGQSQQEANGGDDGRAQSQDQQAEVAQEDTAASTQLANETVSAQAAQGGVNGGDADVQVETQTVTESDTRASSEDFGTSVTGTPKSNGDGGLSNLEKFALGALGAVAVGQILESGEKVVANSGDRVVVQRDDGEYEVLKDDNVLLRRPGTEVTTERFSDGSTRETLTRPNGTKIVTIKAGDGQVLQRTRILPDGREVVLFDDTRRVEPVNISELPRTDTASVEIDATDTNQLRAALAAEEARDIRRRFSLQQIRQIRAVRELVPVIELEAINFETNSAAIRPSEAEELRDLGVAMQRMIDRNPYEVFLVEGHTDAVGSASYNLALSDRRAESVALALTEYFDVPPENMVVQGYGESNLKVRTLEASRDNRRATVRRITPLLREASLD